MSSGIAYRDGANNSPDGKVASVAVTVPDTIVEGDYVLIVGGWLDTVSHGTDTLDASSTATAPVALGPTEIATGSDYAYARMFGFVASADDAGATVTVETASGVAYYAGVSLAAYSGCDPGEPDVYAATTGKAVPLASPTGVTAEDNEWAVCCVVTATNSSTTFTSMPVSTLRQNAYDQAAIADSNGPVGAAGTTIGSGNWSWGAAGYAAAAFTIGLKPASSSGGVSPEGLLTAFPF